jgi:hypothetical protein
MERKIKGFLFSLIIFFASGSYANNEFYKQ